jgi:hypothetical protein
VAKDSWDKLEVLGKVAVPFVVALTALLLNSQVSTREQAARMSEIAVGILVEAPDVVSAPLRNWAISVLEEPSRTIALDAEAAAALREEGLPQLVDLNSINLFQLEYLKGRAQISPLDQFNSVEDCEAHFEQFGMQSGTVARICSPAITEVE